MLRARRNPGVVGATVSLAVVVLGVLATGIWQIASSRASLREQALQNNRVYARLVAEKVEASIQHRLGLVQAIARRRLLAEEATAGTWNQTAYHLRDLRDLNDHGVMTALLDEHGVVRVVIPNQELRGADVSDEPLVREAARGECPVVSESYAAVGAPLVVFACAVTSPQGEVVAIIAESQPLPAFRALTQSTALPGAARVELFDSAGNQVVGENAYEAPAEGPDHPQVRAALEGRSGSGEFVDPGDEEAVLSGYAPIPSIGWAVLVEQPAAAAAAPATALSGQLAVILALVTVATIVVLTLVVRLLRRLERERDRTTAILRSLPDGTVTVDPQGRIEAINEPLESLAGWRQHEVVGRSLLETYPMYDEAGREVAPPQRLVVQALEQGRQITSEGYGTNLLTRDGRRVPVGISVAPIITPDGTTVGAIEVIRDISREKEVDQLKSSLVSTVSHELRTPLTMIQGFSELLMGRDLGEADRREALEHIDASAKRLGRLIDELLSVSRIESGRLVVDAVPVDLAKTVRDMVTPIERRGPHRFVLDFDPDLPRVRADEDKLIQVLTNLISNAGKYSTAGSTIEVAARSCDRAVEVSVSDEGVGMSEEEVAQLFDKFFRSSRPEVQETGGTGLGLYIAKNLVEMQGGQMWVESELGTGTTFTFSLPAYAESGEGVQADEGRGMVA